MIEQIPNPPDTNASNNRSVISSVASGFWSVVTLGYSSTSPSSSPKKLATLTDASSIESIDCQSRLLALQSCHALLILSNYCTSEHVRNPYRLALFHFTDIQGMDACLVPQRFWIQFKSCCIACWHYFFRRANKHTEFGAIGLVQSRLYEAVQHFLSDNEQWPIHVVLVHAFAQESAFQNVYFVTSQCRLPCELHCCKNAYRNRSCNFCFTKIILLRKIVPILRVVYSATERNSHHIYMALIILLILSEDDLFNKSIHGIVSVFLLLLSQSK